MNEVSLTDRNPRRRKISKLLRRATFGLNIAEIDRLSQSSYSAAVSEIMNAAPAAAEPPIKEQEKEYEAVNEMLGWWHTQLSTGGIHEKMTWFWHSLLTTHHGDANGFNFLKKQLTLLRTHALGNYRTLLHEFVKDGSLLAYLDGDGSIASNPNENLARELMELFTLGVGHYTEDDVRSAARALAGWKVDREKGEVNFDRSRAFIAPLVFRGTQANWDTEKIVDHLLDDPQTAINISRQVWHYLGGGWLSDDDSKQLGKWWQDRNYEIKPLVERCLRDLEESNDYQRPKYGLEFFYSYIAVTNSSVVEGRHKANALGQMPYNPPNVAGWPTDERWIGGSQMLIRGNMAWSIDYEVAQGIEGLSAAGALDRCGIFAVTNETLAALNQVGASDLDDLGKSKAYLSLAIASPEFQLL